MSTLTTIFQNTADAIRAKKGTTDSIYPDNFASEIASIEVASAESEFYLEKRTLSVDDGYVIEKIPISAGDVIDLGDGNDVAASTGWADGEYHELSHPAMSFEGWICPVELNGNVLTVPDDLSCNIPVSENHVTADGLFYNIYWSRDDGSYIMVSSESSITPSLALKAYITGVWNGGAYIISNGMYTGCYRLLSINLPEGSYVSMTETNPFSCYSLKSIAFPSTFKFADYVGAFFVNLSFVSIAAGAIYSTALSFFNEGGCFSILYSLEDLYLPDSFGNAETGLCKNNYSLKRVRLPSTMTTINSSDFYNNYNLLLIKIPENITSINATAFYNCYALKVVILEPTTPPTLANINAFTDCTCVFLVPEASLDDYKLATNWSSYADYMYANTEENRLRFGVTDYVSSSTQSNLTY